MLFMRKESGLIFLVSLFAIVSCVEYVNLDSSKEMPVVVNCVLTRDSVQTMKLSRMRVLYGADDTPVEEATVLLQEKDNKGAYRTMVKFHRAEGINWEAKFQPEYDTEYRLVVNIPGEEEITATTRFPEDLMLIQCPRIAMFLEDSLIDGGQKVPAYIMYTAEVRKGKYYKNWKGYEKEDGVPFKAYIEASETPCKIWVFSHIDTTHVRLDDNFFFKVPQSTQPFSEYVATNHPGADRFNLASGRLADLHYWNRPNKPYWKQDPSKVLKANYSQWCTYLYPDIPIFSGFVRIDHPANFRNGLSENDLLNSCFYSDRSFFISGDYSDNLHSNFEVTYYFDYIRRIIYSSNLSFLNEVHFVSEEYDTYLREMYVTIQNNNDFILASYDYGNAYTNIVGGVGIFGADNITWDMEESFSRFDEDRLVFWENLYKGGQ